MKIEKRTTQHILILMGSFIVALAFRLLRLGNLPLSNMEAGSALQALAVSQGDTLPFGPNMAYVGLTGFDFYIFTAGNFLARFWPAMVGSLIVFIPFLFCERIGQWPASILSVVLAISPEMVGLSRIIGSPMMAFVSTLLAVGFLLNHRPVLTGAALAVGLMSGAGFWMGSLILVVAYFISEWLFDAGMIFSQSPITERRTFWTRMGISFGLTLLVVGTGFFMAPAGLSGIFLGLVHFIKGFGSFTSAPFVLLPLTLIAYTAEALVFGIWGSLRGILNRNKIDMFLFVWWAFGLVFILLYPGGTPADLIWVTLPLWVLSVRVVCAAWQFPAHSRLVVGMTTVLVVAISAFMLLMLRSLVNPILQQTEQVNYLIALIGGVVLLVAITLLVNFGWSEEVALPGLLIGLGIVFCAGLISVSVSSTGLAPERGYELWYPKETQLSPEWVEISIERISTWNNSSGTPVDIAVSDYDSPGMRWVLRDYDPVHFIPYPSPDSQPGILITDNQGNPQISTSYRGQDLVWAQEVLWQAMSPVQYLSWLITREAPTQESEIILWVRTDLMPDDQFSP